MKTTIIVALLSLLIILNSVAQPQPPDTMWTRTYGENLADEGKSVQQTTDGGFIIAGWTLSFGADDWDALLIKTNNNGDPSWIRTYSYPGSGWDWANSVRQTNDGGYILTGETIPYGGGNTANVFLLKTNSSGDMTWSRSIGGNLDEEGKWVEQTTDGGYIIVGHTFSYGAGNSDVYLLKTNSEGFEQWHRTFGGSGDDKGRFVQQTNDGGFIITGLTYSFGNNYQAYLIKTNANGIEQWHQVFGGYQDEYGQCVRQTEDGGYIIAAYSRSFSPNTMPDIYIIKTNASGVEQWNQIFGGDGEESGDYIQQTADGGYIIASSSTSFGPGGKSFYLVKTDQFGQMMWDKVLGGPADDWCPCIEQTIDWGYIAVGWTYSFGAGGSDVYLIRMESEGAGILNITLTPYNPPIIIPPGGDAFAYNIAGMNNGSSPAIFDVWVNIEVPGGYQFTILGPIYDLTLAAGSSIQRDRTVFVPGNAPAGEYTCIGMIGEYPWNVIDSDAFPFIKEGTDGIWQGSEGWICSGEPFPDKVILADESLPKEFALHPPYPNPFNAQTAITFVLPEAANVELTIYDITGREVARLADGYYSSGEHSVQFDGIGLASGIYFYSITAGEYTAVKKMMLVK